MRIVIAAIVGLFALSAQAADLRLFGNTGVVAAASAAGGTSESASLSTGPASLTFGTATTTAANESQAFMTSNTAGIQVGSFSTGADSAATTGGSLGLFAGSASGASSSNLGAAGANGNYASFGIGIVTP